MMDLRFEEILEGQVFRYEHEFGYGDRDSFINLSGNINPLHTNVHFAKSKGYPDTIMFGLHAVAIFSKVFGMYVPGKSCLCLKHEFQFIKPMYYGKKYCYEVVVKKKIESSNCLIVSNRIHWGDVTYVDGESLVQFI